MQTLNTKIALLLLFLLFKNPITITSCSWVRAGCLVTNAPVLREGEDEREEREGGGAGERTGASAGESGGAESARAGKREEEGEKVVDEMRRGNRGGERVQERGRARARVGEIERGDREGR